jgi:hypothetical protein
MDHKTNTEYNHDQNQYYYTPQQAYYQYPQYQQYPQQTTVQQWFDYKNPSYVKGAVVGAAVTLLLTNPTVKKAIVKGVVGVWGTLQGGVEELKEQIRDVQAEQGGE